MNLYISPHPSQYTEDGQGGGGIQRVIAAQGKHLPQYGIEIVDTPKNADVINIHAGALIETDKPIVASNHGMYWTGDFAWYDDYWQYNGEVIEALRRAHSIIVPSEWIALPIERDMRMTPYVIPHGIDLESFEFSRQHEGFVLWGKPRADVVSDPAPINELAARAPGISFATTFGRSAANVKVIGSLPHEQFKSLLGSAAVWLATTRETGDIGSREAMAMGIPVLGWNHGATAELITHGETGYLAEPGDYDGLLDGLRFCLNNRDRLATAGRESVKGHQWHNIMGYYAAVYEEVLRSDEYPIKISVVIPTYNYAHFLPDCLKSLVNQDAHFEIVVVNDGSTDNTLEVLTNLGAELDLDVKIVNQNNQGLCAALNTGHAHARGRYVINLDADNALAPGALKVLSDALDNKPWLDVVSGGLGTIQPGGQYTHVNDWPFGSINVHHQLSHVNQLVSSSMMRARSVRRLGGYRRRVSRNEDGEFWSRAMSAGLRFEQVTNEPVLLYRWHDDNKSKREGGEHDPHGPLSWNYFFPHRDNVNVTPFAMTGSPRKGSWAVRSYAEPHIAIIIPVGPGHGQYLMDALDSVAGQTYQNTECIICNDTGEPLDVAAMGHPWVKVVDGPMKGPGAARNVAIAAAKAPLIVPLDADDMLHPDAIKKMYLAWLDYPESIVYMDCDIEDSPDHRRRYRSGDWSWQKMQREAIYQVTILYPKQWWEAVGGYPVPGEDIPGEMGFEDWLFSIKLHLTKRDATYIEEPWGVYRHWTGMGQSERDNEGWGTSSFKDKIGYYHEWIAEKEEQMMGCCPGKSKASGRSTSSSILRAPTIEYDGQLHVVYRGGRDGGFGVNSRAIRGRKYYVFKDEPFPVEEGDEWILRLEGMERLEEGRLQPTETLPASPPKISPIETPLGPPKLYLDDTPPMSNVAIGPALSSATISPNLPPQPSNDGRMLSMLPGVDISELSSLTPAMVIHLRSIGIHKVSEIAYDIEENAALRVASISRVGPKRLAQIEGEIFE